MSEEWSEVVTAKQSGVYGASIYGTGFYGASDWVTVADTPATWTEQTIGSKTLTEE